MYDLYTFGAGHNFKVPGASGNGYKEEVETRRVVKRLLEICYQHGIKAVDTTDNDGRTQRENLNNIVRNCNSYPKNGRLDVAIHFNQAESETGGVEVWYYDQAGLAAKVSKDVAAALGLRDRGAKEGKGLAVLNGTNAPAILIELPFLSHVGNMQAYESNFEPMCRAIVQAVTGQQVAVNGIRPVSKNVIQTGAFSPYEATDAMTALTSLKMTGVFYLQANGLPYIVTDPTSDAQLEAAKEYFKRKDWWFDVK
ncbi:endolysin [Bacillus phage AP50]|uniref:Endolysin n=1 Tax=Bacillus phage AP50 TaxID=2880538 RepID=B6RT63_9VIRU|nr:endolysin [Bacillus phage AP50]ACB54930.1 endolysin [Bacillus phage AP50]